MNIFPKICSSFIEESFKPESTLRRLTIFFWSDIFKFKKGSKKYKHERIIHDFQKSPRLIIIIDNDMVIKTNSLNAECKVGRVRGINLSAI